MWKIVLAVSIFWSAPALADECTAGLTVEYAFRGSEPIDACLLSFKKNVIRFETSGGEKTTARLDELVRLNVKVVRSDSTTRISVLDAEKSRRHASLAADAERVVIASADDDVLVPLYLQNSRRILESASKEARTRMLATWFFGGRVAEIFGDTIAADWTYSDEPMSIEEGVGEVLVQRRKRVELDLESLRTTIRFESRKRTHLGDSEWHLDRNETQMVGGAFGRFLRTDGARYLDQMSLAGTPDIGALARENGPVLRDSFIAMHPNGEEFSGFALEGGLIGESGRVFLDVQRTQFSQYGVGDEERVVHVDVTALSRVPSAASTGVLDFSVWPEVLVDGSTPPPQLERPLQDAEQIIAEQLAAFEQANRGVFRVQVVQINFSGLKENGDCIDPGCNVDQTNAAVKSLSGALTMTGEPNSVVIGQILSHFSDLDVAQAVGRKMAAPDPHVQVSAPAGIISGSVALSPGSDTLIYSFPSSYWGREYVRFNPGDTITIRAIDEDALDSDDDMGTLVITQSQLRQIAESGGVGFVPNRGLMEGLSPPILGAQVVVSQPEFAPKWD